MIVTVKIMSFPMPISSILLTIRLSIIIIDGRKASDCSGAAAGTIQAWDNGYTDEGGRNDDNSGMGNRIRIQHTGSAAKYRTQYQHLKNNSIPSSLRKNGASVSKG
jgi:hypothetical protein